MTTEEKNKQLYALAERKAAGTFLCDDASDENNPISFMEFYKRLQEVEDGSEPAAKYAIVWEPFENDSVDYVLELIDNEIESTMQFFRDTQKIG